MEPEPALTRFARSQLPVEKFPAYDGESPTMRLLLQAKQGTIGRGGRVDSISIITDLTKDQAPAQLLDSADMAPAPIRDFGLSMRRSFRVGWSRDGRIVHAGKAVFAPSPNPNVEDAQEEDGQGQVGGASVSVPAYSGSSPSSLSQTLSLTRNADPMYSKSRRVCVERLDSLQWYRAVEKELGLASSAGGRA